MYESLQAAATGLLVEACQIANDSELEYAVCGGWSPFLRNSTPIQHPGTKDVDLLFSEACEIGALKHVVALFCENGFLHSAKHDFQLLRTLTVNGHDFVFNVDLLHPTETKKSPELFVDQWELPVPVDDFGKARFMSKSIALPDSNFVFSGYVERETVVSFGITVDVPLIDEVALLVTKSKSYLNVKRTRDLFDAFLAITQPKNGEQFQSKLTQLQSDDGDTFSTLAGFRTVFEKPEKFVRSEPHFHSVGLDMERVRATFRGFLSEMGFDDV